MANYIPNSYQTPNFYIDCVMHLLQPQEFVVLMFAAREILGWHNSLEDQQKDLSLDQFLTGCYDKNGEQRSFGCGLSRQTLQKVLKSLTQYGLLEKRRVQKGIRVYLNLNTDDIKWQALEDRRQKKVLKNVQRIANARQQKHETYFRDVKEH
jgi:hypothetical protein